MGSQFHNGVTLYTDCRFLNTFRMGPYLSGRLSPYDTTGKRRMAWYSVRDRNLTVLLVYTVYLLIESSQIFFRVALS